MEYVVLIGLVAAVVAVNVFMWRWMMKDLPPAAMREGRRIALPLLIGVFVGYSIIALALSLLFGLPFLKAALLVVAAAMPVGAVWQLVVYLRGKARAGDLLLDCGPYPLRTMTLIAGVGMIVYFGGAGVRNLVGGAKLQAAVPMLFALGGVGLSLFASGRLQIREHGIWVYAALIEWERIESYRWDGNTLIVTWRTPFRIARGVLVVPAELKSQTDELLMQHAPTAAGANLFD